MGIWEQFPFTNFHEQNLISIHAPPRGATSRNAQFPNSQFYFNSRPSARGDAAEWLPTYKSEVFQFTPLREGRRNRPHRPAQG